MMALDHLEMFGWSSRTIIIAYFSVFEWLNEGAFHRTRDSHADWSKSSMQEDLVNILVAMIDD
jgi:hypothetical protein